MTAMGPQFAIADDSAMDKANTMNLNLATGTHGTIMEAGIGVGDHILPANQAGVNVVHSTLSNPDRAYYSAEYRKHDGAEHSGWKWAREASYQSSRFGVPGRAVVHKVEPLGTISADPNLPNSSAMTADRLKVVDTEWIPHSVTDVGRQGTLPHVNWNQFGGTHPEYLDLNHHEYGDEPGQTGEQRVLRRMVADGRLSADSAHNPDLDTIRAIRNAGTKKPEIPGQMSLPT